jgi:signal transduction histidine kinase
MNNSKENNSELEVCRSEISQLRAKNEALLRELIEVNERLHESEQIKGHFISNVSNELVNPFSSILALSQNIKMLGENEMPMARHMASLIFDEAFHLDFQLKNVFAAALIEAGTEEVNVSSLVIADLIQRVERYFLPLLEKKQIKLLFKLPDGGFTEVKSDREKLEIILCNLISNSIKYSPDESTIEVAFFSGESNWQLEVLDRGKGILPIDRKIIFDRFRQIDEKINSINTGQGLGLSIVKAYTEMLGGKIDINEGSAGGTKVTLVFSELSTADAWDDLDDFIIDSEASY